METSSDKPGSTVDPNCPPGNNLVVVPPRELFLVITGAVVGAAILLLGIAIGRSLDRD